MEFSADNIAGAKVRCLTTSMDVYGGVLTGFDSAFNTTLQQATFERGNSTTAVVSGAIEKAPASSMFVNGSRLLYVGFSE